jgi:hypothetical protein
MASTWVWVLAYVLVFCLFQVLLYRYLQREEAGFEQATPDYGDGETETRASRGQSVSPDGDDVVQCRHCGTYNQQSYRYCWECVEPLHGAS